MRYTVPSLFLPLSVAPSFHRRQIHKQHEHPEDDLLPGRVWPTDVTGTIVQSAVLAHYTELGL